jgi:hypothetical protein
VLVLYGLLFEVEVEVEVEWIEEGKLEEVEQLTYLLDF